MNHRKEFAVKAIAKINTNIALKFNQLGMYTQYTLFAR